MRVTVLTPSRTKMLLDGVETLRDVKRQIMAKTGIPARQQLIYFRGKQLKSQRRPLSSYGVRDDSTLYLVKRLGICRCLACRNSRYLEREEMEEERQRLRQLLGDEADDGDLSPVEISASGNDEVENDVMNDPDSRTAESWLINRDVIERRRLSEVDNSQEEQEAVPLETEDSDPEEVEDVDVEEVTESEENILEEDMDEADETAVEEGEDGGEGEEDEEEEIETEETDGRMEENAVDAEEADQFGDDVEEEGNAMEEEWETEDLTEENEEAAATEEDLELSGEEADDEEEREPAEEEEETETLEAEDVDDEPLTDHDENAAEEAPEDAEDDEDATILYSLVNNGEDNPRREELELTTGGTGEEEEEEGRPSAPLFVRQPAFEEDGANSVGEEDLDIAELENEEEPTSEANRLSPADSDVPDRVEDLLLAMTRPTPDPEAEEDPPEEQYPEDDPLFDPPDEEDPLLAPTEAEDAGYISGDEMDRS